ncbi:hypothetical protein ES705_28911 [subsurface metagenome]
MIPWTAEPMIPWTAEPVIPWTAEPVIPWTTEPVIPPGLRSHRRFPLDCGASDDVPFYCSTSVVIVTKPPRIFLIFGSGECFVYRPAMSLDCGAADDSLDCGAADDSLDCGATSETGSSSPRLCHSLPTFSNQPHLRHKSCPAFFLTIGFRQFGHRIRTLSFLEAFSSSVCDSGIGSGLDGGTNSVIHTATDTVTFRPFCVVTFSVAASFPFTILSVTPVSNPWLSWFRSNFLP